MVRSVAALGASIVSLVSFAAGQDAGAAHNKALMNLEDGLNYVWISPGGFTMGCSTGDQFCRPSEEPSHQVTIAKGFWIGQTLVTQAAYKKVIGTNPSRFPGEQKPVDSVTWSDAEAYCSKVGMRLPTEAEWEYAERSGVSTARYAPIAAIAWYKEDAGGTTHEVGLKLPNDAGLYDMLGNVVEWVSDWWGSYTADPETNPQGPPSGSEHVLRGGGGWWSCPEDIRMSSRLSGGDPPNENVDGFRCVGETISKSAPAVSLPIATPKPYRIVDRWTLDSDNPLHQVEMEADWATVKSDEGWHGLAVDPSDHLLYAVRDTRVDVIDTRKEKLVRMIDGFQAARGIALDQMGTYGFVADSAAHQVVMFDRQTGVRKAAWDVAPLVPEELLFDSFTHTVWVFDATGKTALLLAENAQGKIGTVALPDSPRAAATDSQGTIYAVLGGGGIGDPHDRRQARPDASATVVRIDAHIRSIIAKWSVGCSSPSGIAADPAAQRLFVVCRDDKAFVLSSTTGKTLATVPIDENAAGAAFSTQQGLAFAAADDGFLDVIDLRRSGYPIVERLITYPGASSLAYDPGSDQIATAFADTQMVSPPERNDGPGPRDGFDQGNPPRQDGGPDQNPDEHDPPSFGGGPMGPQHLMGRDSSQEPNFGRPGHGGPPGDGGGPGRDHGPSKRIVIPGTFTVFVIGR